MVEEVGWLDWLDGWLRRGEWLRRLVGLRLRRLVARREEVLWGRVVVGWEGVC